jgi:hypothetical protein
VGLVSSKLAARRAFGPHDQALLWHVIQVMNRIDGTVEPAEALLADALGRTVPQLRTAKEDAARPVLSRKALLDEVGKLDDPGLCRQLFVVAVEAALASGDVNESEDQYLDHLRRALRVDDGFAAKVVEVVGAKYAR